MIAGFDLGEFVTLHGSMSPGDVRGYMERADIYMFTSDFNEGWGRRTWRSHGIPAVLSLPVTLPALRLSSPGMARMY